MRDSTTTTQDARNARERVSLNPESRILNPASSDAAIALLAVMSAVSVMLLVALAFAGSVQIETRSTIYRKQATQAYAMAVGGVQVAIQEIAYPPAQDQSDTPRLWRKGQRTLRVPYAKGVALVEIVNETGKVSLNGAGQEQLARLFEARGVGKEEAAQLALAIDHWRKPPGSEEESFKALDDYYHEAGIQPAHNRFHSVEEMLLVHGMNRDIYYGTAEIGRDGIQTLYGVGQDLTVYSQSSQVNVNYASRAALLSVRGMTEEVAENIIQERRKGPFESLDDLKLRLETSVSDESQSLLGTTDDGRTYTILSVGMVNGSPLRRAVKAVVSVQPQGLALHRIIAWYDEVSE
ncbi:MAG: helix-hairpin-helix domain-containing protein [Terriglobia bacterium]|jgi:type II secretory pathway component PulK